MFESKFQTQFWGLLLLFTSPTTGISPRQSQEKVWLEQHCTDGPKSFECVHREPNSPSHTQQSGNDLQLQVKVKIPHLPSCLSICCTKHFALGLLALPMNSHCLTSCLSAAPGWTRMGHVPLLAKIPSEIRGTYCFLQGRRVMIEKKGWNAPQLTWDFCSGNSYRWAKCPELLLWSTERNRHHGAIHLTPKWAAEVGKLHWPLKLLLNFCYKGKIRRVDTFTAEIYF